MSTNKLTRRFVIMGAPCVGKSLLALRYLGEPLDEQLYFPTIDQEWSRDVSFNDVQYRCQILDSQGQADYTLLKSRYVVGVHGWMLVYSVDSRQSFEMIQIIHDKILDFAAVAKERLPCVIVAQKCDLPASQRLVSTAEGEALAKKLDAAFIESSARESKNVGVRGALPGDGVTMEPASRREEEDLVVAMGQVVGLPPLASAKKLAAAIIQSAKDNKNVDKAFEALKEVQFRSEPPPDKKKRAWWPSAE